MVTGVSESTCVVHFTEYGNYEEVLHDDCVPIDGISPVSFFYLKGAQEC